MAICTGIAPIQRIRHHGEIIAAFLDGMQIWGGSSNDWLWQSDGSEATLLLYRGRSDDPVIPASIDGLPVTALAPTACNYASVRSVTIPQSVRILG